MAPIRIGFVGISASPTAWANSAHLPYLKSSPHYKIVALLNSSVAAAEAAIKYHDLDPATKAYGSPEDLAKDPNVDLVVVSTNVATHYELVKPSLQAGKDAFVEWPLGSNLQQAEELTEIARSKGVKTAVGLQGRLNPAVLKIKEIISSGKIGKVLSTTVVTAAGLLGRGEFPVRLKYFTDIKVGGNVVTIHCAHLMDALNFILGEFTDFQSLLSNQRPTINLVDTAGKVIEANVPKNTHDQVILHGTLASGAVVSFSMRGGITTDGALQWWIYGSNGEIEITSPSQFLQTSPEVTLKVYDANGKVEEVIVQEQDEEVGDLKGPPANVARLYEAYRKDEKERFASFEDSVVRHRFVDELFKSSEEKRTGQYKTTY